MTAEDIDQPPSRAFQGFDWSVHSMVKRLIGALFGKYMAWDKGTNPKGWIVGPGKAKRHLTHFVLDAYRTRRAFPGLCMGVHRSNGYYHRLGDRYQPNHLSCRLVKHATDFLVEASHLEPS